MIHFKVDGIRGKGRPRATTIAGYTSMYTDKKTKDFEKLIQLSYLEKVQSWKRDNEKHYYGDKEPLVLELEILYEIPKGTSKANKALMLNGEILPTKKSDIDNIIKIIMDALNDVAYKDDTQVIEVKAIKKYHNDDSCIYVRIYQKTGDKI